MATQTKTTLKSYFETDDVPTESQYIDLIDSMAEATNYGTGTVLVGATEGTSPPSRTSGDNAKVGGVTCPHYTGTEEAVTMFGVYAASSQTYLYVGGGLSNSQNAATQVRVYLADTTTTLLGTERVRIEPNGMWVNGRLGVGQAGYPSQGIDCVGEIVKLGATEGSSPAARTSSTSKISAVAGVTYANSESLLFGAYGTSSHNYVYVGGGLGASRKAATQIGFYAAANNTTNVGTEIMRLDFDATAGNTRMMLWDVTAGSLKRVSVGAADSGGSGFKVLRVAN